MGRRRRREREAWRGATDRLAHNATGAFGLWIGLFFWVVLLVLAWEGLMAAWAWLAGLFG